MAFLASCRLFSAAALIARARSAADCPGFASLPWIAADDDGCALVSWTPQERVVTANTKIVNNISLILVMF
jgi:hypothetical protein